MNGFILYEEDADLVGKLSDEQRGKLLTALFQYASCGVADPVDPVTDIVFDVLRMKIERTNAAYEKKRSARKKAAEERWNTRDAGECKDMQDDANECKPMQTDAKYANASDALQTMQDDANECKPMQTDANDAYQSQSQSQSQTQTKKKVV